MSRKIIVLPVDQSDGGNRYRNATANFRTQLRGKGIEHIIAYSLDQFAIVVLTGFPPEPLSFLNTNLLPIAPREVFGIEMKIHGEPRVEVAKRPWHIAKINAHKAWERGYYGENVKVAVLDTGIRQFPDLPVEGGAAFIGDDPTNFDDNHSHGTQCAGIIAARGVVVPEAIGVAPKALLYAVKVLDENCMGTTESILKGMHWAFEKAVEVVSMSLAHKCPKCPSEEYTRAVEVLSTIGCAVVAGVGNESASVLAPASSPGVIAVGAVDGRDMILDSSCYGALERCRDTSNQVTVVAPGSEISTLDNNGNIDSVGYTSAACPQVVGLVALLKANSKRLSLDMIKERINVSACAQARPPGINPYGAGLIDCDKATRE